MSISGGQEKIDLMAKQSKTEKWEITSEFRTSNNYSIRCISERLGSLLPGPEDWSRREAMVKAENKGIYKHTGAKSSKVCHIKIYNGIMVAVEYLLGTLNVEADHQSRTVKDSTDWKLNPLVFKKIYKVFWALDINLLPSRISHQVPAYLA